MSSAALLGVYVALEWVSFIHEYKGVPITPWNPGLGVMYALMIAAGARYGLVLFLGALIAEYAVLQSDLPPPLIVAISAVIAIGYGLVALIVRRSLRLDVGLGRLRDVLAVLSGGVTGAVVVAVLLAILLLLDDRLIWGDVAFAATPLLVGDVIGIAVMTPLTLRLLRGSAGWTWPRSGMLVLEVAFYVIAVPVALWIAIGGDLETSFKFFYLLFLPVIVAALRHGLDGACIGLALIQFVLVALSHYHGYDATAFTEIQLLMLMLTVTGLVVGVSVNERRAIDRIARETEARLKEKEAEAAQAARLSLVSGMASALAHEINQPMTAARALARSVQEILRMPAVDFTRADANLGTVIAQIDHAGDVIRRMRDFLRRGRPHVSTLAVRAMLDDALILVGGEAASRGIAIELDVAPDLPPAHGDAVQLQQVIVNLVRNAMDSILAAAEPKGRICIAAGVVGSPLRLEFRVADNGLGIDGDLAARLFEPLTTSKPEGLGLGLSICASIVDAHGGRIWLESGAPGATEFRFSLPLQAGAGG